MTNFTKDLLLSAMESCHECHFAEKVKSLLKVYTREMLVNYTMDMNMFSHIFTNSIVSEQEIHFILLKRYYLSNEEDIPGLEDFMKLLDVGFFATVDQKIKSDPNVRATLMSNYIDNINKTNHQLSIDKSRETVYDKVNHVLCSMNSFYEQQISGNYPMLKKEFK